MKKQPKPKPCEMWGVYTGNKYPFLVFPGLRDAESVCFPEDGESVHRVRIVPVAPKKRAKAKRGGK